MIKHEPSYLEFILLSIVGEIVGIERNDLTRCELNIANTLVNARFAKWKTHDNGDTLLEYVE